MSAPVRLATAADAQAIGQLLHDFNREFDDPTPAPGRLAQRIRQLLEEGQTAVLLGELRSDAAKSGQADPRPSDSRQSAARQAALPDGLAVLRFRPAIWSEALECYLAELYVVPAMRGHGLGRALMLAAIDLAREHGADYMDLGTGESDVAARGLYESLGFSNREGKPDGPVNYYYEREL